MGFSVPLANWLNKELKPIADGLFAAKDSGLANFFKLSLVTQLWQQHQAGDFRYTQELWSLLIFATWWQHYMQPEASGQDVCL
jgi:asparagine synthase (glutamine-hydrolysing)